MNQVRSGQNYGWGPSETCATPPQAPRNTNQDGPRPILPAEWIASPTAPTGMAFCQACGLTGAEGTFLYGNYNLGEVHMVTLSANRRGIVSDAVVYTHSSFVLGVQRGPDGTLYISDGTAIYRLAQA